MTPHLAFVLGAPTSAFTSNRLQSTTKTSSLRRKIAVPPSSIRMQEKKGFFNNPFKRQPGKPETTYAEPQPGDPGSKAPELVAKGTGMKPSGKPTARDLPVISGAQSIAKRGLALLQEDLLKNAPEKAGVGRQDRSVVMKPMAGEPGYKPAAYQSVKVSQLGISPFSDDVNYVSKVGGVDAVVKAAQEVKKGATAKAIKKQLMQESEIEAEAPEVFDIPDYLKPLPEDTPRRGMTWKNYVGR